MLLFVGIYIAAIVAKFNWDWKYGRKNFQVNKEFLQGKISYKESKRENGHILMQKYGLEPTTSGPAPVPTTAFKKDALAFATFMAI